jgi:hypothetical protein
MRLWTLQNRAFLDSQESFRLSTDWEHTPENWRDLYRWMCAQWTLRVGGQMASAPVWGWHSCNGRRGSPPTVGTLAMLMGDWNFHTASQVVLELEIPDRLALLSSYDRWNQAMDDALDRGLNDIDPRFQNMFDRPLLRSGTDDIQAVIPYVERSWIIGVRSLPEGDISKLNWNTPCSRFPKRRRIAVTD